MVQFIDNVNTDTQQTTAAVFDGMTGAGSVAAAGML
jgi:hypothetical protein